MAMTKQEILKDLTVKRQMLTSINGVLLYDKEADMLSKNSLRELYDIKKQITNEIDLYEV